MLLPNLLHIILFFFPLNPVGFFPKKRRHGRNHYTNYAMLVQRSPLLSYCILTGSLPPLDCLPPEHTGQHSQPLAECVDQMPNSRSFSGYAPSTEASHLLSDQLLYKWADAARWPMYMVLYNHFKLVIHP